jgi:hypothetical protein
MKTRLIRYLQTVESFVEVGFADDFDPISNDDDRDLLYQAIRDEDFNRWTEESTHLIEDIWIEEPMYDKARVVTVRKQDGLHHYELDDYLESGRQDEDTPTSA